MGVFTPFPHEVNKIFQNNYSDSPSAATNWYYNFNKKINYIRSERVEKNLSWTYESEFGTLDITINRSKPEKDPRDIAAAKDTKSCELSEMSALCGKHGIFRSYDTSGKTEFASCKAEHQ